MQSTSKWRRAASLHQNGVLPPPPIFRSITMVHAWHAHGPPTLSKPVSSAHKLRPPHSHTPFLPAPSISPGKRSSCTSTRAGRGRLVPSLHATQQSSCWQPPSASPPALMTFINELHSFWLLMKSASQTENEPALLGTAFVYMAVCLCICRVVVVFQALMHIKCYVLRISTCVHAADRSLPAVLELRPFTCPISLQI